jgi:hypothetical protein
MKITPRNRWRMQVLLLLTIALLAVTGLVNWLLPHGGAIRTLRHLLRWVHEGAAIGFLALLAFHLYSQTAALRRNLHRFGFWGRDPDIPSTRPVASSTDIK